MTERQSGQARRVDTGHHYQEIRHFFDLTSSATAIPPQLIEVYEEFIQTLSPMEKALGLKSKVGQSTFTISRPELLEHMRQGDEIGRDVAESFLEVTYSELPPKDQAHAQANPEFLVQTTVERFQAAIDIRRQRS